MKMLGVGETCLLKRLRCMAAACCLAPVCLPVAGWLVASVDARAAETGGAVRPADTSSPRATLKSFIESTNEVHERIRAEHYFDRTSPEHHPVVLRILDCLDVSELPEYERMEAAGEIAVCLKEILDRVELPAYGEIPDVEAIDAAGGLETLPQWRVPGTRITIARVEEGPQRHEYLFSPGTVGRAVEYYGDLKAFPYRTTGPPVSKGLHDWYVSAPGHPAVAAIVDRFPDRVHGRVLGQAIWKWAGLLLTLVVFVPLLAATYRLYGNLARRFQTGAPIRYCLTVVIPIVAVLIPVGFRYVAYDYLTMRGTAFYVVSFVATVTALLASLLVVFAASNRIAETIIASPQINPKGLNAQLIRIASKLLSLLVAVIILLQGGHFLGIPVTTLLASAGIGGLAVALAAQDTLKTLFGTILLLSDKPFRVGERIVFGKYDGVVEDIGLRSTKIRLLTGHQVTIPNDELARIDIENVGRRPYIRRAATIEMPSDTPVAKVKRALEIVRGALEDHEQMSEDYPPRVFLRDLKESSIGIFVIYWYNEPNYWDFLAFGERVNLTILEQFEAEQIPFAAPALTVHTPTRHEQTSMTSQ